MVAAKEENKSRKFINRDRNNKGLTWKSISLLDLLLPESGSSYLWYLDSRLFACASEWDIRKSVKEMTRFLLVTDIDALVG